MKAKGNRRCLFCRAKDDKVFQKEGKESPNLCSWAEECCESFCNAFELPVDHPFKSLLVTGKICRYCVQILRDLDFVTRLVCRLTRKKNNLIMKICDKLRLNCKNVPKQIAIDVKEAEGNLLSGKEFSYDEILYLLHNRLIGPISHDKSEPSYGTLPNGYVQEFIKVEVESHPDHFDDLMDALPMSPRANPPKIEPVAEKRQTRSCKPASDLDYQLSGDGEISEPDFNVSSTKSKTRGSRNKPIKIPKVSINPVDMPVVGSNHWFPCKQEDCNESFQLMRDLRFHIRKVHNLMPYPFDCWRCMEAFETSEALQNHMRKRHSGKDCIGVDCSLCGQIVKNRPILRAHIKTHHSDDFTHKCAICTMVFKDFEEMKAHNKAHDKAHPFACIQCESFELTNTTDLRRHVQITHYPRELRCPLCSQVCANANRLEIHIKLHSAEKIQCKQCDYHTTSRKSMSCHVQMHIKDRRFVCKQCGEAYKFRSSLVKHIMSHTGERPYKCRVCGKGFKVSDKLKLHEMTHSSGKLHTCQICHETFDSIDEIVVHQSEKHGNTEPSEFFNVGDYIIVAPHSSTEVCTEDASLPSTSHDSLYSKAEQNAVDDKTSVLQDFVSSKEKQNAEETTEEKPFVRESNPDQFSDSKKVVPFKKKRIYRPKPFDAAKYPCTVNDCAEKFSIQQQLRFHIRKVHEKRPKPYDCRSCLAEFERWEEFQSHSKEHKRKLSSEAETLSSLKCYLCGLQLSSRVELKRHIDDKDYQHSCSACSMMFTTSEDLCTHVKLHTNAHPFDCVMCDCSLTNTTDLRKHMKTKHYPSDLHCQKCPMICVNKYRLELHLRKHEIRKISCKLCDYQTTCPSLLKHHMTKHSKTLDYSCSECGVAYKHKENLKRHMMSHSGVRPYKCKICGRGFKVTDHLKRHENIHQRNNPQECFLCKKVFSTCNELQSHQLESHPETQEQTPQIVKQEPKLPKSTKLVRKRVRQKPTSKPPHTPARPQKRKKYGDRPVECSSCGMKFMEADKFDAHEKLHVNRSPFDCVICTDTFTNVVDLKQHVIKTHFQFNFVCEVCGTSFWNFEGLRRHRTIHNEAGKKKCPHCPYSTTNSVSIADHVAGHTGEKRHTCDICGKSFQWSRCLTAHLRVHSGEKLHTCTICGQSFGYTKTFKRHQLSHAGMFEQAHGEGSANHQLKTD